MATLALDKPTTGVDTVTTETGSSAQRTQSYGQILRSSALIGGSSILYIAIGVLRTKAMALLLGPAGFGLNGLFSSISDVTFSVAGMGLNSSGVRQIAAAAGSGEEARVARTAAVLRRLSLAAGLLAALVLALFAAPISRLTFESSAQAGGVCLLGAAVFFRLVSGGQSALLQGTRRIGDLARTNVYGPLAGSVLGVACVYVWRDRGIVPALVAVAAMTAAVSWRFSRRAAGKSQPVPLRTLGSEAAALLTLGFAFMASSFLTMGAAYAIRLLVVRHDGVAATGFYQAAWTLGGLYVSFILQAMGADFYPRLTASAHDHQAVNRIVNEQTLVGLLMAGPGVLATLTGAPVVLSLFYSAKFAAAVPILRWICLGALMQVLSWPMGYIVLAKGRRSLFLGSDLAWALCYLGAAWLLIERFGLAGAGMAFFVAYAFHAVVNLAVARRLTGFRVTPVNRVAACVYGALLLITFGGFARLPFVAATAIGVLTTIAGSLYSLRTLLALVPAERWPAKLRPLLMLAARFLAPFTGRSPREVTP